MLPIKETAYASSVAFGSSDEYSMRDSARLWVLMFLSASLLLTGCSTTLHEKKSTDTDPGESTNLKFTGDKVKVVHDF
jgi:uncharacterized lipoprotein YajG